MIADPLLQHVLAVALAFLFGLAAVHKWRAPSHFSAVLQSYGVPQPFARLAGTLLVAVEGLLCAGLLWPGTRRFAAAGAVTLLLIYAGVLARAVIQGRDIGDCGCGTGSPQAVQSALVWRNLVLVAGAGLLGLPPATRDLGAVDVVTGCAALLALLVLYGAVNTLIANQPRTREMATDAEGANA